MWPKDQMTWISFFVGQMEHPKVTGWSDENLLPKKIGGP